MWSSAVPPGTVVWGKVILLVFTYGVLNALVDCANCCLLQREEQVVLGTEIHWGQPVAKIHGVQQLYAEFVHIDVAVLQVTYCP